MDGLRFVRKDRTSYKEVLRRRVSPKNTQSLELCFRAQLTEGASGVELALV